MNITNESDNNGCGSGKPLRSPRKSNPSTPIPSKKQKTPSTIEHLSTQIIQNDGIIQPPAITRSTPASCAITDSKIDVDSLITEEFHSFSPFVGNQLIDIADHIGCTDILSSPSAANNTVATHLFQDSDAQDSISVEQFCSKLSAKTLQKYSKGNFLIAPSLCRLVKDGEELGKGPAKFNKEEYEHVYGRGGIIEKQFPLYDISHDRTKQSGMCPKSTPDVETCLHLKCEGAPMCTVELMVCRVKGRRCFAHIVRMPNTRGGGKRGSKGSLARYLLEMGIPPKTVSKVSDFSFVFRSWSQYISHSQLLFRLSVTP
jgi:hypothetical protein